MKLKIVIQINIMKGYKPKTGYILRSPFLISYAVSENSMYKMRLFLKNSKRNIH
jgi:hypothetical protein